jgi:probable phosphoglycerate mutase
MPDAFAAWRVLSSPLRRALATARALGVAAPEIDPRLIEMSWGDWEGRRLVDLRAELGPSLAAAEALGLDFRPPGGESPRDVQARIAPLLREIAGSGMPTVAITHKGVMRAILALAANWDMRGKPPCRLDGAAAQLFRLDSDGRPAVERLGIALVPA